MPALSTKNSGGARIHDRTKLHLPVTECNCQQGCEGIIITGEDIFFDSGLATMIADASRAHHLSKVVSLNLRLDSNAVEREMALAKLTPRERVLLGLVSDETF